VRVPLAVVPLCVLAGAVLVVSVRTVVAEPVRVSSDSMEPTLVPRDVVHVAELDRGDLVTFRGPRDGEQVLKRVVAIGGDSVAMLDAVLHVNSRRVEEPYVDFAHWDGTFMARVEVPPDAVYVLGDNRARSVDSRDYGPVPVSDIDGRVLVRVWPPVRIGAPEPRPARD
jgi:signal peptidase I